MRGRRRENKKEYKSWEGGGDYIIYIFLMRTRKKKKKSDGEGEREVLHSMITTV